ncbi:methyltransferase, FkbM family [Aliiroseovarius sediminilitoris]|uniref:Methyltransferase, FkbM family n=1 Tax=Aliiroseovarius sediminilitoris TaxID=1173584 RepID=A0A1I0NGV5_9RHOB|nr:FkbM family methyltransferase [Aliiroseovarius sediminilitoris]SEW00511.1 methyltransferase, FkbM family [Aliiroseovarius sediminilitoris]
MPRYSIDGIDLDIPLHCLNDNLKQQLQNEHYEWKEVNGLKRHLKKGDRVLDLGGGAGYIAIQAARIAGAGNVATVEASAEMVQAIGRNLVLNHAEAVRVLHGAVVPDDFSGGSVEFDVKPAFWSSAIAVGPRKGAAQRIKVPALRLSDLLHAFEPNLVIMDVEGAERDLARQDWPLMVQLVIMEIHPQTYPPAGIQEIFDGMSKAGFAYMPWGSRGNLVVFQRLPGKGMGC